MRSSILLTLTIALSGSVLAAPPAIITQAPAPKAVKRIPPGTPDCTSIEHYCKTCGSDDFNCETDPNCEWCRAHSAWDSSTTTSTSSTSTSTSTTTSTSSASK